MSQSKPGIKMVDPEPCKELRRRPQLLLAGTAPYLSHLPGFSLWLRCRREGLSHRSTPRIKTSGTARRFCDTIGSFAGSCGTFTKNGYLGYVFWLSFWKPMRASLICCIFCWHFMCSPWCPVTQGSSGKAMGTGKMEVDPAGASSSLRESHSPVYIKLQLGKHSVEGK